MILEPPKIKSLTELFQILKGDAIKEQTRALKERRLRGKGEEPERDSRGGAREGGGDLRDSGAEGDGNFRGTGCQAERQGTGRVRAE